VEVVRQLRPEDIKNQAKADTMSFLAMLNEKKQVNKNVPNNLKSKSTAGSDMDVDAGDGHSKSHGFVSTFASLAGRNQGSGDEDDGWEVVDDAAGSSQSPNKQNATDQSQPVTGHTESERPADVRDEDNQQVKTKDKKKKKSARKEDGKKKKRKDKKRKHTGSGSGADESDDSDHKKHRKRKRSASPATKSPSKVCKLSDPDVNAKGSEEKKVKKERKDKKKSKHSRRSVSVSGGERISRKKSKKKKSKKSSLKKKKRKSSPSSESSDSDSGSKAVTSETQEKHKKVKDEDKSRVRRSSNEKASPTAFQFPRSVLMYTQTQPSIQYSRNPRTILLNPADDTPIAKVLPVEAVTRTAEQWTPPEKSAEKIRTSDRSLSSGARAERASPPAERKYSSDSRKEDDHSRDRKVSSSGSKSHQVSKSKCSDRNSDSSHKRSPSVSKPDKSVDKNEQVDSVKQELLEKVTQKRKDSIKSEGKDLKVLNDKIVIGKIKQPRKPATRQPDKATPQDMNQDYGWYQQQYATMYSMDPYTAAYYAQYAMLTSNEYSCPDITAWLKGYGFAYDPNNTSTMQLLPPTVTTNATTADTTTTTDAPVESGIPVLTKAVPDSAVEQFYQPSDATDVTADTQPEEMDVESDNDDCPSPPAPPPPPLPPQITNLVVEHAFTLPNGQEVPAGTKQVIVHPYPESHPLSSHFTPEFVQSSLNSLQSSKCEERGSGRIVSNGASNSTSVVT
jgi:hypothetical protein